MTMRDMAPHTLAEQALVDELKVRARAVEPGAPRRAGRGRLRDALHEVARGQGFTGWEHARRVLSGLALPGDDMGSFWHVPRSGILLHIWFSVCTAQRAAAGRRLFAALSAPVLHRASAVHRGWA
jgi:hypothetical protein